MTDRNDRMSYFCTAWAAILLAAELLGGCAASTDKAPAGYTPATVAAVRGGTGGAPADADEPFPPATPKAVVAVTRMVFPAVVRLDVSKPQVRDGRQFVERSIGSGVIFDDAGHVLTNFHVAGNATEIYVTLFDKERVRARLVGDDHWTDLAVVQIDMDEVKARNLSFSHVDFGTSATLVPGQDVMAVGTPFGLARTMTLGTISTVERTFYPQTLDIDGYETGDYSNWVQMDVPINPGNSGGPLVDLNGKVVGINTRGGAQNLNFAVPIDTARPIVASILETATPTTPGRFDRSDLGVDLKPMQDLESFYRLDTNRGVLVNGVQPFSAAAAAGVKPQDVLLDVNGRPTNARFPEELAPIRQMIAALPLNSAVTLTLQRGGHPLTLSARTDRLQGAIGEEGQINGWGLSVRDVTRVYAAEHRLDAVTGVVVTSIVPNGPSANGALLEGDVIESVNGQPIENLDGLRRAASSGGGNVDLLLKVHRGVGRQSMVIHPDAIKSTQPATTQASN